MTDPKQELRQKILSKIQPPRIGPNKTEAVPDAEHLQTERLQAAPQAAGCWCSRRASTAQGRCT